MVHFGKQLMAFYVLNFMKNYMKFFNTGLIFTRKYLFNVQEYGAWEEEGPWMSDIPICWCIQIN